MSAQHSKSESALLEVAMGCLAQPLFTPSQLPLGPRASQGPGGRACMRVVMHVCSHSGSPIYYAMCSCCFSLPSPACSLRAWFRRASFGQTAPTTSLSPWSGGSRRRKPVGGHTWCTAGKSSRSGQSLPGTFTMKVGRGQGPELCFHSYLWGAFR